jgi:NAD(P)H-hydrate epimerase
MPGIVLSRDECRQIDHIAVQRYGITGLVLMENAGRGVVDVLEHLGIAGPIVILCGKGNNAGDGFVIARHLAVRGHACRTILLFPPEELRDDARTNYEVLSKLDLPIEKLHGNVDRLDALGEGADWLIDALLGTGATGNPRPPVNIAIDWFNGHSAKKLAVDVPSGLDCDTGQPGVPTIRADHTCTFVAMKQGFTVPTASSYTGQIHVLDIGVPI